MMKRAFDVLVAVLGLIVCLPLFVMVAVAIKLDSAGSVLFKQLRVGRGVRNFVVYKFRTMIQNAPHRAKLITVGQDARITRIGQVLRRYKIDEFPQLINVLKGDMSLVGPRPEVPRYVGMFRSEYEEILAVRPGVTDLASLKYIDEAAVLEKAEDPEEEYIRRVLPDKIRLARIYLEQASFLCDLAIITQTLLNLIGIPAVIFEHPDLQPHVKRDAKPYAQKVKALILRGRRPLIVTLDLALIILANYLAFWLRFDGDIPENQQRLFLQMLPWLVWIRGATFVLFRLNEGLWRYTSIWDLQSIGSGVLTSTLVFFAWVQWGLGITDYPRSVVIIDSILLVGFLVGVRLPSRVLRESLMWRQKKRVLIVGAGDTGERIVREMKTTPSLHYEPIGFIDDNPSMVGQRIHGVRVLGTREDIARILAVERPHEVLLALPRANPATTRDIIARLESSKVPIKTLPSLKDGLESKSAVSQIRNLALEDLLSRAPVGSHTNGLHRMIAGRRVLITGAGGSIGSELCRQMAALEPEALILFERHENSLYTIGKELADRGHSSIVRPVIGDVTDVARLHAVMKEYRPTIMFHAAAHKHVPLMELNAGEALKNNCIGTRIAAEAADKFEAERFVLISTDKAVNPSSVMGATKRVAELVVQRMARRSRTRFLTVRFGNVLGSNGSVVLRFKEQIEAGGPVTVTHSGVRRYFMLISEAVHLVLQAATLGDQGAIYVLDMGEQIKVLDLASNLIRLSGYVPGKDIPIRFIGLRPGEKLVEELVGEGETAEPSPIDKILRIRTGVAPEMAFLLKKLVESEQAAVSKNSATIIERLRELVPTFKPSGVTVGSVSAADTAVLEEAAQPR